MNNGKLLMMRVKEKYELFYFKLYCEIFILLYVVFYFYMVLYYMSIYEYIEFYY